MAALFNVGKQIVGGTVKAVAGDSGEKDESVDEATRRKCCLGKSHDDNECPDTLTWHNPQCAEYLQLYCSKCQAKSRMPEQSSVATEEEKRESAREISMKVRDMGQSSMRKAFEYAEKMREVTVNNHARKCEIPHVFGKQICKNYCSLDGKKEWCHDVKQDYCKDKYWSDPYCQAYCTENPDWCNALKQTECNKAGEVSEKCMDFCHDNPNLCDVRFRETCPLSTDEVCTLFCSHPDYENYCRQIRAQHCNTDEEAMKGSFCQDFAMRNHGWVDGGMEKFCKQHPDDPHCACINSEIKNYNPLCIDTKCTATGYGTQAMLESRGDGCEIIDCSQSLNIGSIAAGKGVTLNPTYKQKCMLQETDTTSSQSESTTSTENTNVESTSTDTNDDDEPQEAETADDSRNNMALIIGGSVAGLIIVGLIIYLMVKK